MSDSNGIHNALQDGLEEDTERDQLLNAMLIAVMTEATNVVADGETVSIISRVLFLSIKV